jgi:hypothetical protein
VGGRWLRQSDGVILALVWREWGPLSLKDNVGTPKPWGDMLMAGSQTIRGLTDVNRLWDEFTEGVTRHYDEGKCH